MRRVGILHAAALLALATGVEAAEPQYPTRPVRLIALNPPGGVSDTLARAVGEPLAVRLRQPVVVDNRVGASGIIGSEIVARSAADGHTLLLGFIGNLAINPGLYPKLPYDTVRDFAPVSLVGRSPLVLVTHPSLGARSVPELIALARTRSLTFSSAGSGNGNHLVAELFRKTAGIDMRHIPFKGGPAALTAVIAGEVSLMFSTAPPAIPQVRAGTVRALGVTTGERIPTLPEVPTVAESGLRDFMVTTWFGLLAPARTPPAIINRLNAEVARALEQAAVKERLARAGLIPAPSTPQAFKALIVSEIARWREVIRESGARAD